jgi:hypothetical protein
MENEEGFTFSPEEIPVSSRKGSKYVKLLEEVINHPAQSGRIGIPSGIKLGTAYSNFNKILKDKYPNKGITIHKRGENLYIEK